MRWIISKMTLFLVSELLQFAQTWCITVGELNKQNSGLEPEQAFVS
jgi:hypothetical protein